MTMMPHGKTLTYRCSLQGMQTSGTPQARRDLITVLRDLAQ